MPTLPNPKHESAAARLAAGANPIIVYRDLWGVSPDQSDQNIATAARKMRNRLMPRIRELRDLAGPNAGGFTGTILDQSVILRELARDLAIADDDRFDQDVWLTQVRAIADDPDTKNSDRLAARALEKDLYIAKLKIRNAALAIATRAAAKTTARHEGGQNTGPRVVHLEFKWGEPAPPAPPPVVLDVSNHAQSVGDPQPITALPAPDPQPDLTPKP